MKQSLNVAVLTLVAGIGATAALAQDEGRPLPQSVAEAHLAEFADCVVARRAYRARVDTFLRTTPGGERFGAASHEAADLSCLNAAARRSGGVLTMRIQPPTYRDALYPALYRRDFRDGPPAGIAALPALDLADEFEDGAAGLPAAYRPARAFGDCVARADPAGTHALISARPNTPAENQAIDSLRPAFGNCLPEGQTLRFNRAAIRAFTGEAMYKLAAAARAGGVQGASAGL